MTSSFTSRATNIHKFYKNVPKWEEYFYSKQATFDHLQNAILVSAKFFSFIQSGTKFE